MKKVRAREKLANACSLGNPQSTKSWSEQWLKTIKNCKIYFIRFSIILKNAGIPERWSATSSKLGPISEEAPRLTRSSRRTWRREWLRWCWSRTNCFPRASNARRARGKGALRNDGKRAKMWSVKGVKDMNELRLIVLHLVVLLAENEEDSVQKVHKFDQIEVVRLFGNGHDVVAPSLVDILALKVVSEGLMSDVDLLHHVKVGQNLQQIVGQDELFELKRLRVSHQFGARNANDQVKCA